MLDAETLAKLKEKESIIISIIGTREVTDADIDKLHELVTEFLDEHQLKVSFVYSGNAVGVDQLAKRWTHNVAWLPWLSYNNKLPEPQYKIDVGHSSRYDIFLSNMFPYYNNLTDGVKKMLRRNVFIIFGESDVNPKGWPKTDLVFYYTGKGVKGGTKYGVEIAKHFNIPVVEIIDKLKGDK